MRMTLRNHDALPVPGRSQVSFETGGSIGRGEACDWVLDADGVSRLHASVRCLDGIYFIEDHSTNGVLHNGAPLRKGTPAALKHGDTVQIDVFEIDIAIASAAGGRDDTQRDPTVGGRDDATTGRRDLPVRDEAFEAPSSAYGDALSPVDPMALFDMTTTHAGRDQDAASAWSHVPEAAEAYRAPVVSAGATAQVLPENWDLTRTQFSSPEVTARAAPPPAPTATSPEETSASLRQEDRVPEPPKPVPPPSPEARRPVGPAATTPAPSERQGAAADVEALLLEMLGGVMELLRARAEFKNGLRLPLTLVQRRENNPLKFAPTAEEALARLLSPPDAAYLSGADAIEDAVRDLRQHQVAMLAGMRAASEAAFAHFDPGRFEGESTGAVGMFGRASRPWNRYAAHYDTLRKDPDERFRRLFGDEFARVYEEQLSLMKQGGTHVDRTGTI